MSDIFDDVIKQLANAKDLVCVTAAAGCGKTEAIARAVNLSKGKQLILTHTNAGIAELQSRLREKGVSESKYRVETIASWLLGYVLAYPSMSGFDNTRPQDDEWKLVYPAAQTLFSYLFIKDILKASYSGVFVDEYQDCVQEQHSIILKIADYLPVRVLGDPLQGIYRFGDNIPVEWSKDVLTNFRELPKLTAPYRWKKDNPSLGKQLIEIRERLLNNEAIDLREYSEVKWLQWSAEQEMYVCQDAISSKSGTITGIHQWPKDAHNTAKRISGKYQSIEEMGCKALIKKARYLDNYLAQNNYQAIINSVVKNLILEGSGSRSPFSNPDYLKTEFLQLEEGDLSVIAKIIDTVLDDENMQIYRRELFNEMKKTILEFDKGEYATFEEAAYDVRSKTHINGRKPEKHIVSRTLLIKGLQFKHAIVLNADALQNRENFYVAITRGSKTLTVLSAKPIISF